MKAILLSSAVMTLTLLGDALIYPVLPLHAAAFGISLPWVGVLLSANRFIRVFAYGLVARATEAVGMRRACIAAAVACVVATGAYGLADGPLLLLAARVLYGIAYAALVLITLGYAVEVRAGSGGRIGWSRAMQRVGPVSALLIGPWLTTAFGPRLVFVLLAAVTAVAIPLAMALPRDRPRGGTPSARVPSLERPTMLDLLFFQMGGGVDGIFIISITLILAQQYTSAVAVALGSALLAMRHLSEGLLAPLFGRMADRFGARRLFLAMMIATTAGFVAVALGATVPGALVMLCARGALAAIGPALVVEETPQGAPVMRGLARLQAWRDLGAAVGPLATGYLLLVASPQLLHGLVAVLIGATLAAWVPSLRASRSAPTPAER